MKETTEVVKAERVEATEMLAAIMKAVSDPNINVDKMERLLAMHERIVERNAKVAFESALSRVQAKLPVIQQNGVILGKDKVSIRSRYARYEDIDAIVRPLLSEEGFSLSFDTEEMPSGKIRLIAKLAHRDGHSESKGIPLPIDKNEYRTAIQDHGSTVQYGRRYLIKMHLNLIEKYEDNDGQGADGPISEDQVRDLEVMIQDSKADLGKFLEYMEVEQLADITTRHYKKAITALEHKKRSRR
jgi:hypothetical protein